MPPTVKLIELAIRRGRDQHPARGGECASALTLARDGGRAEAPRGAGWIRGQFPRQDVSGRGRASLDLADIAADRVRLAVTLLALVRGIILERSLVCSQSHLVKVCRERISAPDRFSGQGLKAGYPTNRVGF